MTKRFADTSFYCIKAEILNDLYKEGFRYWCEGNYRTLGTTDPWSGMPNTAHDIYFYSDLEDCKAFAEAQKWVFNRKIHAEVNELYPHYETREEEKARIERERAEKEAKKAAKKARKLAKETAEATAMGMTLEEYQAYKKRMEKIRYAEERIAELEAELAEQKAYLAKLKGEE